MVRPRKPEAERSRHLRARHDRKAATIADGRSGPHDEGRLHPRRALGTRPRGAVHRLGPGAVELRRIGVNLNQIARALNSGASAPAGTLEAVERVGELAAGLLTGEALDR